MKAMKANQIAMTILLMSASVQAQPPKAGSPPGPGHVPKPQLPAIMQALDADNDGEISDEEISKSAESLAALDQNKDGKISPEELRPKQPGGPGPQNSGPGTAGAPKRGMRPPPIVDALDADRDGRISADEMEKATAALKSLDKNQDGELTGNEMFFPPQGPPPPEPGDKPPGPP
jgi:hypothetical protein